MIYLGLLALGAFVGTISTFGLKFITGVNTFFQAVILILSASLGGIALIFIERFKTGSAVGAYCVGLTLALMWVYANIAIENIQSTEPAMRFLGWSHMVGVVVVNLIALALVLPPAFREVWKQ